ncbi:DUF1104 domain-containing protein [Campylobacter curvus]|uniref:DUF1104 domain-containing protein n=1 Tax=Campylobacter curvus TaxID=200 RepID=UPI001470223E|nr:DUF1104 domain-containing protein [Campylobacter curvus]
MKKIALVAVLMAGSMFAASLEKSTNEELYAMMANADAKTLSDIAFEIDKRVGELKAQIKDTKRGFKSEMRKKLEGMSAADRYKFMQDFRTGYNEKVSTLSVKEADRLDIELKKMDDDFDKHHHEGGFMDGKKFDKKHD